jgi:hypothetical protein
LRNAFEEIDELNEDFTVNDPYHIDFLLKNCILINWRKNFHIESGKSSN